MSLTYALGAAHPADRRVPSVTSLLHFIGFGQNEIQASRGNPTVKTNVLTCAVECSGNCSGSASFLPVCSLTHHHIDLSFA